MNKRNKAFLLNFICFAVIFIFFRYLITIFLSLPYLPLLVGAALLASFLTPKFIVNKNQIYIKFPFIKKITKL